MHRTSTDRAYLESGVIVIDADGIEVELPPENHTHHRLDTDKGYVTIDSSGGVQHGTTASGRVWWVDETGTLLEGTIPAARVPVLAAALYDSGPRDITALATGVTAGTLRLRVKNGWARLDFANVKFDTENPKPFGGRGPLNPWGPVDPESGKGFVTQVNTGTTYRVSVNYAGGVDVYGAPAGTVLNGHVLWPFDRTPPATPIGDPA